MSEAARSRRIALLGFAALWVMRILVFTWRIRYVNREIFIRQRALGRPAVIVFWHGQILGGLWSIRQSNTATMVSEHGDGEILSRVAVALGCRQVRGSTSRGAARALLAGAREIEGGHNLAITPDGPRGPAKSVAPGAVAIAHRTGAPIIPIGIWASSAWHLKSWDRFMIPKPFARVNIAYGEPIYVDSAANRKEMEAQHTVYAALEAAIARATPGAKT